jgi:hypothetical protein
VLTNKVQKLKEEKACVVQLLEDMEDNEEQSGFFEDSHSSQSGTRLSDLLSHPQFIQLGLQTNDLPEPRQIHIKPYCLSSKGKCFCLFIT